MRDRRHMSLRIRNGEASLLALVLLLTLPMVQAAPLRDALGAPHDTTSGTVTFIDGSPSEPSEGSMSLTVITPEILAGGTLAMTFDSMYTGVLKSLCGEDDPGCAYFQPHPEVDVTLATNSSPGFKVFLGSDLFPGSYLQKSPGPSFYRPVIPDLGKPGTGTGRVAVSSYTTAEARGPSVRDVHYTIPFKGTVSIGIPRDIPPGDYAVGLYAVPRELPGPPARPVPVWREGTFPTVRILGGAAGYGR